MINAMIQLGSLVSTAKIFVEKGIFNFWLSFLRSLFAMGNPPNQIRLEEWLYVEYIKQQASRKQTSLFFGMGRIITIRTTTLVYNAEYRTTISRHLHLKRS